LTLELLQRAFRVFEADDRVLRVFDYGLESEFAFFSYVESVCRHRVCVPYKFLRWAVEYNKDLVVYILENNKFYFFNPNSVMSEDSTALVNRGNVCYAFFDLKLGVGGERLGVKG